MLKLSVTFWLAIGNINIFVQLGQKKCSVRQYDETDEKFNPNALLRVNRVEDEGNDVWTVFNRIQENLTHDVKDKQTDIWLNQQLYDLAGRELVLA